MNRKSNFLGTSPYYTDWLISNICKDLFTRKLWTVISKNTDNIQKARCCHRCQFGNSLWLPSSRGLIILCKSDISHKDQLPNGQSTERKSLFWKFYNIFLEGRIASFFLEFFQWLRFCNLCWRSESAYVNVSVHEYVSMVKRH